MKPNLTYDLKVYVRLRPKQRDVKKNYINITDMNNFKQITLRDPFHLETGDAHMFLFDNVFAEDASQATIFEQTSKTLLDVLYKGKNAAVIAYGNSSIMLSRNW